MELRDLLGHRPARDLLGNSVFFVAGFALISLLIGNVIVPGPLLYDLSFFVYGGLGYVLLAMGLFFVIWTRERLFSLPETRPPHEVERTERGRILFGFLETPHRRWLLATIVLVWLFRHLGMQVKADPTLIATSFWPYFLGLHLTFLAIFLTLGLACFPVPFIKTVLRRFRRELLICLAIGLVFYGLMRVVWLSWPLLSLAVSRVVYALLHVLPGGPVLIPPQTISVGGFTVYIGEACSGVFSIFLFSSLYLLLLALDWDRIRHGRAGLLFLLAVVGLFFVNVLRVYLIILVGVYYDPVFAVNLFHSYIGMLLFIAFFLGFLWLTGDWLKRKRSGDTPRVNANR